MSGYELNLSISLRDLLLVAPAWIGAIVAIKGLGAWRAQLRGRDEYELARRLLKATYKYRDALIHARAPLHFDAPKRPGQSDRDHAAETWQQRINPVNEARLALEAELLESEVMWGAAHRENYQTLFSLDADLYAAILEHLDSLDPNEIALNAVEALAARRAILYARADRKDEFSYKTKVAPVQIEVALRPYLSRSGRPVQFAPAR